MADATLTNDADPTVRPTRGLRGFSFVLSVLMIVLAVSTAIAVPVGIAIATGNGSVSVDGTIKVPYVLDIGGEPRISIGPDGSTTTEWDGAVGDPAYDSLELRPTLDTTVHLAESDLDSRAVASAAALMWLSAAWVGLVSLRRVVRDALSGSAFGRRNSRRLRWCAVAVLSAPVTGWIVGRLLEATLDPVTPGVHLAPDRPDWGLYLLVGLGLLALAEVFRSGAVLQELELQTV